MRGSPARPTPLLSRALVAAALMTAVLTAVLTAGPMVPAAVAEPVPLGSGQVADQAARPESRPQPATGANPKTRLGVINHNIERRPGALSAALSQARRSGARLVTLQEICWWQARDLARAHPDWTVAWMRDGSSGRCRPTSGVDLVTDTNRSDSGMVVVHLDGRGARFSHVFDRQFQRQTAGLLCLHWKQQRARVHLCTTHLVNRGAEGLSRLREIQLSQARQLRVRTARWTNRGDLVIVAGDFNATPNNPTLDELYRINGSGRFHEATSCPGRAKVCRRSRDSTYDGLQGKIDYVFYSANRMVVRRPHAIRVVRTTSDHHLLQASAYVDLRTRPSALASR